MKQRQFEAQHAALWAELEAWLAKPAETDRSQLPARYRALCQSLSLARQRGYSPTLTERLHQLALATHRQLYGTAIERPATLRRWLLVDFPCQVRREWRLVLLALATFAGLGLLAGGLVWLAPDWAYSWVDAAQLAKYRAMYDPAAVRLGRQDEGSDLLMFGFYIWNNVSIGFRTFAGGLLGGLPAWLSLAFNGLHLGVIASWLSQEAGTRQTFWSFVITHAAFEIPGLLLSGVAGLRLGLTLLRPGPRARGAALRQTASSLLPLLAGAALLTVIAAFVEAFWSAQASIAPTVKYLVGTGAWAAIMAYFLLVGRHHAA